MESKAIERERKMDEAKIKEISEVAGAAANNKANTVALGIKRARTKYKASKKSEADMIEIVQRRGSLLL